MGKYEDLDKLQDLLAKGVLTQAEFDQQKQQIMNTPYATPVTGGVSPEDAPNTGMAVLGFFIPLVGLILYLVWRQEFPQKAASTGKGALIGFIVSIVLYILLIVASVLLPLMLYRYY